MRLRNSSIAKMAFNFSMPDPLPFGRPLGFCRLRPGEPGGVSPGSLSAIAREAASGNPARPLLLPRLGLARLHLVLLGLLRAGDDLGGASAGRDLLRRRLRKVVGLDGQLLCQLA